MTTNKKTSDEQSGDSPASLTRIAFKGAPAVLLESAGGASAVVTLHGAQLVSWQPARGAEWIYLSERAEFGQGKAIRGGVPICFPQFSTLGDLPRHGLVRTRDWTVAEERVIGGGAMLILSFVPDAEARPMWPAGCKLEFTVLLEDERIDLELAVDNTGSAALEFTAALHSYFAVSDVEDVTLSGLRGCALRDVAAGGKTATESGDVVVVRGEHDRIYFNVPGAIMMRDPVRSLGLLSENFPDLVVWNPGAEKCAEIKDMPPEDWRGMLCVEAGAIGDKVVVPPGESWFGRQALLDLASAGGNEE